MPQLEAAADHWVCLLNVDKTWAANEIQCKSKAIAPYVGHCQLCILLGNMISFLRRAPYIMQMCDDTCYRAD